MEDAILCAADRAETLFRSGYNCAQAVYGALAAELDLPQEDALRIASMLGAGVARTRGVCGAALGALLAAGTRCGNTVAADAGAKQKNYDQGRELLSAFTQQFGTTRCSELLGLDGSAPQPSAPEPRTEAYYASRPCIRCIRFSAAWAEQFLREHPAP